MEMIGIKKRTTPPRIIVRSDVYLHLNYIHPKETDPVVDSTLNGGQSMEKESTVPMSGSMTP